MKVVDLSWVMGASDISIGKSFPNGNIRLTTQLDVLVPTTYLTRATAFVIKGVEVIRMTT